MTREEAINTLGNFKRYISGGGVTDRKANKAIDMAIEALKAEAVQDEAAMTKQEIFDYLDNVLHPIVSPDNWYVYSDLHDMIEELPFLIENEQIDSTGLSDAEKAEIEAQEAKEAEEVE